MRWCNRFIASSSPRNRPTWPGNVLSAVHSTPNTLSTTFWCGLDARMIRVPSAASVSVTNRAALIPFSSTISAGAPCSATACCSAAVKSSAR